MKAMDVFKKSGFHPHSTRDCNEHAQSRDDTTTDDKKSFALTHFVHTHQDQMETEEQML